MDKEKLQVWALTAEIISGVAVVATLLFLAFEMRDNTNAAQAQTFQTLMQEINGLTCKIRIRCCRDSLPDAGRIVFDCLSVARLQFLLLLIRASCDRSPRA